MPRADRNPVRVGHGGWPMPAALPLGPALATVWALPLLAACSLMPREQPAEEPPLLPPAASRSEPFTPAPDCGGRFSAQQRMYLDLVHDMVRQGRQYAALAHLDQLEKTVSAPQSRYLRAEALRRAGRPGEAEPLYRELTQGCMAGYGLHGLGLLAAEAGRLEQAEDYLRRAGRERPVDAEIHNDLGMVSLLRGQRQQAREQFLTAAELDRKNPLPVENLIVLMLAEKQEAEARQLADRHGLTTRDLELLLRRAQRLGGAGPAPAIPSTPSQE